MMAGPELTPAGQAVAWLVTLLCLVFCAVTGLGWYIGMVNASAVSHP